MSISSELKKLQSFNRLGNEEERDSFAFFGSRPRQLTFTAALSNYEEAKFKYNELFDHLNESASIENGNKFELIKPSIILLYQASEDLKYASKKTGSTKEIDDIDNEVAVLQKKLEVFVNKSMYQNLSKKLNTILPKSNHDLPPPSTDCPPDCLLHCSQLMLDSDDHLPSENSAQFNNVTNILPTIEINPKVNDVKKEDNFPTSLQQTSGRNNSNNRRGMFQPSQSFQRVKPLKIRESFSISKRLFKRLPVDIRSNNKIRRSLRYYQKFKVTAPKANFPSINDKTKCNLKHASSETVYKSSEDNNNEGVTKYTIPRRSISNEGFSNHLNHSNSNGSSILHDEINTDSKLSQGNLNCFQLLNLHKTQSYLISYLNFLLNHFFD